MKQHTQQHSPLRLWRTCQALTLGIALAFSSMSSVANTEQSALNTTPALKHDVTELPDTFRTYKAEYKAYRKGEELGWAERTLSKLPDIQSGYRLAFKSFAEWFFLEDERTETSEFLYSDKHIQPLNFTLDRRGSGPDKVYKVTFDRENKAVLNKKNRQVADIGWNEHWLDPIAVQQQVTLFLMRDDKNGDLKGKEYTFEFLNRKAQPQKHTYRVVGPELITLPSGPLDTIKLERVYDKGAKKQSFIWLSPKDDYLLVRLQKIKKRVEQVDIVMTKIEYDDSVDHESNDSAVQ